MKVDGVVMGCVIMGVWLFMHFFMHVGVYMLLCMHCHDYGYACMVGQTCVVRSLYAIRSS